MKITHALPLAMATAASFAALPASAQDTGDRSTHFQGLYVGGGGGYQMQSNHRGATVEFDTDNNGTYGDTVTTVGGANAFTGFCGGYSEATTQSAGCKGNKDRGEYFGRVGYDMRRGDWVVGALVEGGGGDTANRVTAFSSTPQSYAFSRGVDWSAALRLRAGYTPGGGVLFYGTGGGVYANMRHEFRTTNTSATFARGGGDDAWGWQAGGGVEAMVLPHVSIGMEYLYTNLDDKDFYVTASGGAFGSATRMRPADHSYETHAVRGTVNFRF